MSNKPINLSVEQLATKLFYDYTQLLARGIVMEPEHLVDAWLVCNLPGVCQGLKDAVMKRFFDLCYESAGYEWSDDDDDEVDEDWGLFEDGNIFKDY